jgi:hypothetical protein
MWQNIETHQARLSALVSELNQLESDRNYSYTCSAHPRLDHILVRKQDDTFRFQWLDANGKSLPPSTIEDDPTDFSRSAWRGQGEQGFLELDIEGAASLILAVQFVDDLGSPMDSSARA